MSYILLGQIEDITLGQVSTMLGIGVAFISSIEFLAFRMRKYIKKVVKEETGPIQNELKTNTLNTLKNTICNTEIPLGERLQAGKEYIERGGNGGVKIYYHKLEEEYERKLQKEEKL